MIGCHQNCKTCLEKGDSFENQKCIECKEEEGYYKIKGFNSISNSSENNCYKEGEKPDCFYFNNTQFEICHFSCLTCKGKKEDDCITCYNDNELKKNYSIYKNIIGLIKNQTDVNYYDFEDEGHKLCLEEQFKENYYFDEGFKPCYNTCKTCQKGADSNNHNCRSC